MSDKVEKPQEEEVEEVVTETDEKSTDTEPKTKAGKTFNQDDVNKLIGRERASLQKKHAGEIESRDTQIESYEAIIKTQVEARKKELPEFEQKILEKLSLLEQYELLNGDELKVSKKTIPTTKKDKEAEKKFEPTQVEKVI